MDKEQKRHDTKGLLVYLGITFLISWAMFFTLLLPGVGFLDEGGNTGGIGNLICTLGMLCPALGVIITRYITKEGHNLTGKNSLMLGIDLKNGKYIFYIIAVLLPWIYTESGVILKLALSPGAFDKDFFGSMGADVRNAYFYPLMAITSGVFISIGGLGEEMGWRGYMMPKLISLCGTGKAVVIGGVIWGIWHWPLTYVGHNFGTDYKGYPWLGFAAMIFLCVFLGILLTFVTVKTGSVWPAAILHAVNNARPSIMQFFINPEKIRAPFNEVTFGFLISELPMAVIALGIMVVLMRKREKD